MRRKLESLDKKNHNRVQPHQKNEKIRDAQFEGVCAGISKESKHYWDKKDNNREINQPHSHSIIPPDPKIARRLARISWDDPVEPLFHGIPIHFGCRNPEENIAPKNADELSEGAFYSGKAATEDYKDYQNPRKR